jgi:hypothetical protein
MQPLFQLAAEYRAISDRLNDSDLDSLTIEDTLNGASGDIEAKVINISKIFRNMEAMAEQIKQAESQMYARRKAIEKRAASLKAYLHSNMEQAGIQKIECPWFVVSVKKNPAAVVIDDAGEIPCDLYVYPEAPEPYPDKKAIAERIKSGEVVSGAHLAQGTRLEIK